MTGFEILKDELIKRGFTKQQVEKSKMLPAVLDILSGGGGQYLEIAKLSDDINELKRLKLELEQQKLDLEQQKQHIYWESASLRTSKERLEFEIQNAADRIYKQTEEYIEKFFNALETCETPEARDSLKIAQMFINTVDVDTKYDNTAFIVGLSAILSKGEIAPVDSLTKINKKIPEIRIVKNGRKYEIEVL